MGWEAWFTLFVLAAVFVGLSRNYGPPDAVVLGGAVAVALAGVVEPEQAFGGFVNPGLLTVAALFVVAAGMRETGALDVFGGWFLARASSERGVVARMAGSVPLMSAFLNNTPIVAMMIPVLSKWCRSHQISPSRVLMPLSYMAILGGTCTLIGTSTNLVVSGLLAEAQTRHPQLAGDLAPIGMFELTWVGLPYAVAGCLYLIFVAPRLIPDRKDLVETLGESMREYLVEMEIKPECRLVGQRVQEAGLRHLPGLFLIEIVRNGEIISPVGPRQPLRAGDILTFTGMVSTIVDLERIPGLVPVADEEYETRAKQRRDRMLCEAVISSKSPLIGKTIRDADFRATYNAAVVAVHRGGKRLQGRVGDIRLENGDTLLLQTGPHFARAHRNNPDFILVSGVEESRPARDEKTLISAVLLGGLVLLLATGLLPTHLSAFLIAGLMVATRCISAGVARQSVDWQTLITIGAAFGLGAALEESGAAETIAGFIVAYAQVLGPIAILAVVYLLTSLFTETVTNNAAAALMFPFVIPLAMQSGIEINPRPLAMAVAFAASASLVTPIGYQTNLMVFGPGGYRFSDFAKVGLPLNVLLFVIAMILIPIVWPF